MHVDEWYFDLNRANRKKNDEMRAFCFFCDYHYHPRQTRVCRTRFQVLAIQHKSTSFFSFLLFFFMSALIWKIWISVFIQLYIRKQIQTKKTYALICIYEAE